jgi:hypothetical protein
VVRKPARLFEQKMMMNLANQALGGLGILFNPTLDALDKTPQPVS